MNDKTKIPLSWAFILLGCSGTAMLTAVAVGLYAGRIEGKVDTAQSEIADLKGSGSDSNAVLRSIDERLSRIEGMLGTRKRQLHAEDAGK